jgi:hypothetical protein
MGERSAYSRVYWSIADDPRFEAIYGDDHHLATWLRLLLIADQAHPASAHLPRIVHRASLRALLDSGLIDAMPGDRYRVHGLDAERERRRTWATTRGPDGDRTVSSTDTERSPNGAESSGLRRDETRLDKGRRDDARESLNGYDGRADLEAFVLITRRAPTARQRQLLDGLLTIHDLTGPQWAADIMLAHPEDPIGAVIEADKAYRAERIEEAKAQEKPKPAVRRRPGLPETTRELLEHWKKQEQEGVR